MKSWLAGQKDILIILTYWTAVFGVLVLLKAFFIPNLFHESSFLNYDAAHYEYIRHNGYHDFRVVFFPLFPKLWSLLNFSAIGMACVNGFLYLVSLMVLVRHLKMNERDLLLVLTLPSAIFFFLPYSESVFFFSSVLLLLGIAKNNWTLLIAGLFLTGISRPAFTVFLPALLILEIVRDLPVKLKIRNCGIYVVCSLLALLTVGVIQFIESGKWFTFFSEQQLWGNRLQFPSLPLRSWSGVFITKVDGVALLVGLICMFCSAGYAVKKVFFKKECHIPDIVFFSMLYVAGISLSVLLFRGGSLFSLNRFVFATPFVIVLIDYLLRQEISRKGKLLLCFFVGVFAFWLLFNSFVHLQTILKFLLLTIYLTLGLSVLISRNYRQGMVFWMFVLITFEIQIYFFIRFLGNEWVA